MMLTGAIYTPGSAVGTAYVNPPAIVQRVPASAGPFPCWKAGTGGLVLISALDQAFGYLPFEIVAPAQAVDSAPYAKLMEQVQTGFGRTLSRLPQVFGVSRQTLYNWLNGETPKEAHQERLRQLAEAAQVFTEKAFKPTPAMLDRTVADGRSFLELIASGADGRESATRLIRLVERGLESRARLGKLLDGRTATLRAGDVGAAALDEDA